MKIKREILQALRLVSGSELAREVKCTGSCIYYQMRDGKMGAAAAEKYAAVLGRSVFEMFDGYNGECSQMPFDVWLLDNIDLLPESAFNSFGKVRLASALELWDTWRGIK